jgi:hypothetical protein
VSQPSTWQRRYQEFDREQQSLLDAAAQPKPVKAESPAG